MISATQDITFRTNSRAKVRRPVEAPALDADLYLIVVRHPAGDYLPEVDLSAATLDKVADAIWYGEHASVAHVVRFNPVAGTSRIADAEVAELLCTRSHNEAVTPPDYVRDFIEAHGFDFFEDAQFRADRRIYDREMMRA